MKHSRRYRFARTTLIGAVIATLCTVSWVMTREPTAVNSPPTMAPLHLAGDQNVGRRVPKRYRAQTARCLRNSNIAVGYAINPATHRQSSYRVRLTGPETRQRQVRYRGITISLTGSRVSWQTTQPQQIVCEVQEYRIPFLSVSPSGATWSIDYVASAPSPLPYFYFSLAAWSQRGTYQVRQPLTWNELDIIAYDPRYPAEHAMDPPTLSPDGTFTDLLSVKG